MTNKVVDFNNFHKLNESKSNFKKKDLGIFGPFKDGSFEILIDPKMEKSLKFKNESNNLTFTSHDNSIEIPKNCCMVKKDRDRLLVKTLANSNWFSKEENTEKFETFVENFIENSFHKNTKDSEITDNLELILGEIGVNLHVNSFEKKANHTFQFNFSNGLEAECKVFPETNFIKTLKFYKDSESINPIIVIKISGDDKKSIFRTENGNFTESETSINSLINNPIFKYLFFCLTGHKKHDLEEYLIDYYNRLMKYHNWKDSSDPSKNEKHFAQRKEIDRLRKILQTTVEDSELENMFIRARESFLSSNRNT